jgi:molybdopterin molybdotransferase
MVGYLSAMISVEEARERILANFAPLSVEEPPLLEALGQTVADDVRAAFDIPPLDNTAMDGYAVRAADTSGASESNPITLRVIGELAAGYVFDRPVEPGTALRIMTGAPMPAGADTIVPFEETDETGRGVPSKVGHFEGSVRILKDARPGNNIRRAGEDVRAGEVVVPAGTVLRPAHIGVLASLGHASVRVIRRPVVAILSTGDEVLEPGQPRGEGQIYDSNSYSIAAMVLRNGGIPLRLGIARDTIEELTAKVREAMRADMLITSAGVSRGDFDVVKEVLAREGRIDFWLVNMRPGKPLAFGVFEDGEHRVPHIGLPGNPVSSMVTFELFGRPAMQKMMGRPVRERPYIRATTRDRIRMTDERRFFARCVVTREGDGWIASLAGSQGSGVLTTMARGNGLAVIPEGSPDVQPGEQVNVLMLDWEHDDLSA